MLTLAICTRNRSARLGPCLAAIDAAIKPDDFQLVLIDNGSSDDTRNVLDRYAQSADFNVTVASAPEPGLSKARNVALQYSKGDVIAFTDDDCYIQSDYLIEIVRLFERRPDIGYFGGRVLLHDPTDFPDPIKLSIEIEEFPSNYFHEAGSIHGANFGFRRKLISEIGRFREHLGAGTEYAGEDLEYYGRASAKGWTGIYHPGPTVSHHHGRKQDEDLTELLKFYNRGRIAYYTLMLRHPKLRRKCLRQWFSYLHITKNPKSARQMITRACKELVIAGHYLSYALRSNFR